MKIKTLPFIILLSILFSCLLYTCAQAETYEVGQTATLCTAADYGTNKWSSSDTSIVQIVSASGQYCTINCLRVGTAKVKIYVYYDKLIWDPILQMLVNMPCVDLYYTYDITVRSPQCILINTSSTKTTASFSFDAPTNASSVQMKMSCDSGATWSNAKTTSALNSSSESAVVSGLTSNTSYLFKLSVTGGIRAGDSNVLGLTTKAYVSGVSLDKTELKIFRGQTATLTANVLPENAENKNVSWTISGNLATITSNPNGTATIIANSSQNGQVTATVTTAEGNFKAYCTINIVDPPPNAPSNLRATDVGDTSITLAWDAVSGAQYYYVYINSSQVGPITGTNYTFDELFPTGTNTYYVTACNEGGESLSSNVIEVTQKNCITTLSIVSVTDTEITVKWEGVDLSNPFHVIKVLEYRELGDFTYESKSYISDDNTITYTGFSPDTTYEIRPSSQYFDDVAPITVKTYPLGIKIGAEKPIASKSGGTVLRGTKVILTTNTIGAAIYYTTDGSTPTKYSIPYNGPISITNDITIKAIAVKSGMGDSLCAEYSYKVTDILPQNIQINSASYNESDKTLTVTLSINNNSNNTGKLAIAVFDSDGILIKIVEKDIAVGINTSEAKVIPVNSNSSKFTVKAFFWNDLSRMEPISNFTIKNI